MKLFLSSYRAGNFPEELVNLFGKGAKVALIANAADYKSWMQRQVRVFKEKYFLRKLGFKVCEIDLRKYFGKQNELEKKLEKFDAVWVRGGNTYILRKAFYLSGFDNLIKKLLQSEKIKYGGSSAGAVIMPPSLKGLEIVDDPNITPKGYPSAIIWDGLGIIDKYLLVHFGSIVAGLEGIKDTEKYYIEKGMPFEYMKDTDVYVVNGDNAKLYKS